MKRSRLKLFKTTSLTISLIGIILILISIGVIAYIGVSGLTNSVSTTVNSGSSYDQLNQLKSEYSNVSEQYLSISDKVATSSDQNLKTRYNEGKIKLSEANTTLSTIESMINNGKPDDEIQAQVKSAKENLEYVKSNYSNLTTTSK